MSQNDGTEIDPAVEEKKRKPTLDATRPQTPEELNPIDQPLPSPERQEPNEHPQAPKAQHDDPAPIIQDSHLQTPPHSPTHGPQIGASETPNTQLIESSLGYSAEGEVPREIKAVLARQNAELADIIITHTDPEERAAALEKHYQETENDLQQAKYATAKNATTGQWLYGKVVDQLSDGTSVVHMHGAQQRQPHLVKVSPDLQSSPLRLGQQVSNYMTGPGHSPSQELRKGRSLKL